MEQNKKQMALFEKELPTMPEHFKGTVNRSGGYTHSAPRKWTDEELDFVKDLKSQGYNNKDIAKITDRTEVSIQIKLKRSTKKNNTYNRKHVIDKYNTNETFLKEIKPKSVLDVYSGNGYYKGKVDKVISNDIDIEKPSDYHLDALSFCCLMMHQENKFDLVDLDPFGSSYDCFDLAIKMANKAIIITFGEMGHKR